VPEQISHLIECHLAGSERGDQIGDFEVAQLTRRSCPGNQAAKPQ
jgi:hypothetical protein